MKTAEACETPDAVDRRGHGIIQTILRHSAIEERHAGVSAHQSPLAFTLRCMELGAIIHTTARTEPPDYASLPPREALPCLPSEAQRVCDAIIEDGQGDRIANFVGGNTVVPMTLDQRVGWLLGSQDDRGKWLAKFSARDKTPALLAMQIAGNAHLATLFAAWP